MSTTNSQQYYFRTHINSVHPINIEVVPSFVTNKYFFLLRKDGRTIYYKTSNGEHIKDSVGFNVLKEYAEYMKVTHCIDKWEF